MVDVLKQAPDGILESLRQERASMDSTASNTSSMSGFSTTSTRNVRWKSNIRALPEQLLSIWQAMCRCHEAYSLQTVQSGWWPNFPVSSVISSGPSLHLDFLSL
jgi:hypothetical protein